MSKSESTGPFAAKITSQEAFAEACLKVGVTGSLRLGLVYPKTNDVISFAYQSQDYWWLVREQIREETGVYEPPSDVLRWLRSSGLAGQYFPHVSRDSDPSMVAYTPDSVYGKADRQVKTSIGKFLRKFCLMLSDKTIAELEARHRAEVDPTFLVARTIDEIEYIYNNMAGDSGCMRYDRSKFGHETYHPSAVYASPGLAVAYVKGTDDRVMARSVIYDNPDDASDKRYVRLYGAAHLATKLERSGYRQAGLAGVKLTKLTDAAYRDDEKHLRFVLPYIDRPGGGRGSQEHDPECVFNDPASSYLLLLDKDTSSRYRKAGAILTTCRSQAGSVYIEPSARVFEPVTCALSGNKASHLEEDFGWYFAEGMDEPSPALMTAIYSTPSLRTLYFINAAGSTDTVFVREDQFRLVSLADAGHSSWLNTKRVRDHVGVVRLDPTYYPANEAGRAQYCQADLANSIGEDRWIKCEDTLVVIERNPDNEDSLNYNPVHISEKRALRKQGYVLCVNINGTPSLAHPSTPGLVKLRGRRMAVADMHPIVQLADDTWELTKNTISRNYCGVTVRIGKTDDASDVRLSKTAVTRLVNRVLDIYDPGDGTEEGDDAFGRVMRGYVRKGVAGLTKPFYMIDGVVMLQGNWDAMPSEAQIRAAVAWARENGNNQEALDSMLSNMAPTFLCWAHHAGLFLDTYEELRIAELYGDAEAEALDYSDAASPGSFEAVSSAAASKTAAAAQQEGLAQAAHPDDQLLDALLAA